MTTPANDDRNEGVFASAAHKVGDAASNASHAVTEAAAAASEKVTDAAHAAKIKAADTAAVIRDKAADAYDAARDKASSARDTAATGFDSAPLAVLAGGIALGAILGALLPRTERETELLGPVASKATDAARSAFVAAKSAGQDKLDELGINKEAARAKVDQLVDTASQAATSAGAAAKDAVRTRSDV
ncbi:hypothetical protein [Sphingomonas montana]|uniref:hypothetical protein n=1 Tax=Sphingomonas montana TaxID=1843236 RepID=UPI0009FB81F1|nr:hypothetical protein [Sphingomonas montana]